MLYGLYHLSVGLGGSYAIDITQIEILAEESTAC